MYGELVENAKLRAVFNLVRREPGVRFTQISKKTGLHDPEVAAAIRDLKSQDLIWPTSIPTRGARVFFAYELAPKGKRVASFLDALAGAATKGQFKSDPDAKSFAAHLEATKV